MNAYKIELPDSYGVHPIFNVADLSPYTDPPYDDPEQTGMFATQGGEGDEPLPPIVGVGVLHGSCGSRIYLRRHSAGSLGRQVS